MHYIDQGPINPYIDYILIHLSYFLAQAEYRIETNLPLYYKDIIQYHLNMKLIQVYAAVRVTRLVCTSLTLYCVSGKTLIFCLYLELS